MSQKRPRERYAILTAKITSSPRLSSRVAGKRGVGKLSKELHLRLYERGNNDEELYVLAMVDETAGKSDVQIS